MLPKPIKNSEQKNRSELQGKELSKIQSELDFVVLNEAFTKRSRNNISDKMKDLPHTARLPRKGGILKVMDSGVMVMSRYPIEVLGQSYYKKCGKADCFASKGVLLVEVTLPSGKKVQVASTHLQSGQQEKYARIRETQLAQIKELLSQHARPGVPQLLAGDLNMDSKKSDEFSRALAFLNMTSTEDSGEIKTSKSSQVSCFGAVDKEDPKAWLDHVLISKQGGLSQVIQKESLPLRSTLNGMNCDLSDHLPVKAKISIDNNSLTECLPPRTNSFENFKDLMSIPFN